MFISSCQFPSTTAAAKTSYHMRVHRECVKYLPVNHHTLAWCVLLAHPLWENSMPQLHMYPCHSPHTGDSLPAVTPAHRLGPSVCCPTYCHTNSWLLPAYRVQQKEQSQQDDICQFPTTFLLLVFPLQDHFSAVTNFRVTLDPLLKPCFRSSLFYPLLLVTLFLFYTTASLRQ